jgi:hypothetical protein
MWERENCEENEKRNVRVKESRWLERENINLNKRYFKFDLRFESDIGNPKML